MKNKKSLGQNWLTERTILEEIADISAKTNNSSKTINTCIEIGPGLGTLTSSLLKRYNKVIAIEFDSRLANNLPKSFPGKNLIVKNEDILQFDFDTITEPFVVVGNIPYYITTPIIKKLLTLSKNPGKIVLLIQEEVAKKICNKVNTSSLSLFVDNLAETSLGPTVERTFFTPPPKVDSQVIIITPRTKPKYSDIPNFMHFIQKCFQNPRKKLISNLSQASPLSKSDLQSIFQELNYPLNARPSELSLDQYAMLAKTIKKR